MIGYTSPCLVDWTQSMTLGNTLMHYYQWFLKLQGSRGRLSRELIALWSDGYDPALSLLKRILPPGLLRYLQQRKPQIASTTAAESAAALAAVCKSPAFCASDSFKPSLLGHVQI